jgi:hypothetical protein
MINTLGLFDVIHLLTFTGHMPLEKAFMSGWLDILFGTDRSLKLF